MEENSNNKYIKKCIVCEQYFDSSIAGKHWYIRKTCSTECLHKHRSKVDRSYKKVDKTIQCVVCKKYFDGGVSYKQKKTCSTECLRQYKSTQEFKDNLNKSTKEYFLKTYGVEYHSQLQEHKDKDKVKETWKNKPEIEKQKHRESKTKLLQDLGIERSKEYFISLQKKLNEINLEIIDDEWTGTKLKENVNCYRPYSVKCHNCNSITEIRFTHVNLHQYFDKLCKTCYPVGFTIPHQKIKTILDETGLEYSEMNLSLINPFELDFYIPSLNIAIEVNGIYWHSELHGYKDKKYHLNKTNMCNKLGIKLIHIFEDEIEHKFDIVKSKLLHILGKNNTLQKIYARKCNIKIVDNNETNDFLEKNHIQGKVRSEINLGLYYNGNLIAISTFCKPRIALGNKNGNNSNNYELLRYCTGLNTNVLGGLSKLLSFFNKNYNFEKIISYCDIRWSGINPDTTIYNKIGFNYISTSKPNYWYLDFNKAKRYHRFKYNKQYIIKEMNGDPNISEWENMKIFGYDRIWDCGSIKFIYNKK